MIKDRNPLRIGIGREFAMRRAEEGQSGVDWQAIAKVGGTVGVSIVAAKGLRTLKGRLAAKQDTIQPSESEYQVLPLRPQYYPIAPQPYNRQASTYQGTPPYQPPSPMSYPAVPSAAPTDTSEMPQQLQDWVQ